MSGQGTENGMSEGAIVPSTDATRRLRALDKAHVWHPFTQMRDWLAADPLIIAAAEGNRLIDTDGVSYLDGVSSLWTNVHGHRHPRLDAAVRAQLDKVAHTTLLGLGSEPSIELAARLAAIAPQGLTRVFYSDSGSTSVEVALKIAFQFHRQAPAHLGGDARRTRFLSLSNAYHGDTVGAVALGGMDLFHAIYAPLLFDTLKAESPHCYRCPFGRQAGDCGRECIAHVEDLFARHGHEMCAAVVEPLVQGAAGMLLQPPGWLRRVRELCDAHGVFLVADEVAVGFGKTGTLFACEQEGVTPDFLCLAKGISGGYLPLAATLTAERVHDGFLARHEELRTFFHGHTYTGNPLACAAAIASLDVFEEERVMERLQPKIARLAARLETLRDLPHVGDIRQRGVMTGIELVRDRETRESYDMALRVGHRVTLEARRRGVIVRPLGDVMVLMPPLSITDEEIDLLVDATGEAIRAVTERGATGGLDGLAGLDRLPGASGPAGA
ncbi:adenosylmethionine--8-amino-7-oxononanoate transaminase [Nitratidesulfovibrio sp. 1201_IL3209]